MKDLTFGEFIEVLHRCESGNFADFEEHEMYFRSRPMEDIIYLLYGHEYLTHIQSKIMDKIMECDEKRNIRSLELEKVKEMIEKGGKITGVLPDGEILSDGDVPF